jgi:hypothetical protein
MGGRDPAGRRCVAAMTGSALLGAAWLVTAPADARAASRQKRCEQPAAISAAIRERIDTYAFLVDGWSPSGTRREWAQEMFTTDAVLEGYDTAGRKILDLQGRANIASAFDKEGAAGRGSNHFIPNTRFLEIGCERVTTESKGFTFAVRLDGQSGTEHRVFLYRDVWVRAGGAWRKQSSQVRYIN